jgi:hypothetical protein
MSTPAGELHSPGHTDNRPPQFEPSKMPGSLYQVFIRSSSGHVTGPVLGAAEVGRSKGAAGSKLNAQDTVNACMDMV